MTQLGAARRKLATRFDEELRFLRGWMHRPRAVGSIAPTSAAASRRMASVVDPSSGLPVLELGPGTGVVTRAILALGVPPERLYSIEFSREFAARLRAELPRVNIIHGNAFDLDATLGEAKDMVFDSVVSGLPLLNFPVAQRVAYVVGLLSRIPAGRPVMQMTYGARSPVPPGRGDYTTERYDFILRNIPPVHLWVYRRPLSS